jgi:hypothetical protein
MNVYSHTKRVRCTDPASTRADYDAVDLMEKIERPESHRR